MTSPTHFFFVAKNKRKFFCYFDGEKKTIVGLQCGSNKKKAKNHCFILTDKMILSTDKMILSTDKMIFDG